MTTLPTKLCSAEGCAKATFRRGYCAACYKRLYRRGLIPNLTLADRFWQKVNRAGPDECWEWTGSFNVQSYGHLLANGRRTKATHVSWFLYHGEWPNDLGLYVLHKCDNPPCVNPEHLFLGTNADNARDRSEKGRSATGTDHAHAKLTESDVKAMRRMYAAGGISQAKIGALYGVTPAMVHRIVSRTAWKHI